MPANPGFDSKRPIRSAASLPRPAAATRGFARVSVTQFVVRLRGVERDRVAELPGVPSILVEQCCRLLAGNPRWIWRMWIMTPLYRDCLGVPKGEPREISRWRILLQRTGTVRATLTRPCDSQGRGRLRESPLLWAPPIRGTPPRRTSTTELSPLCHNSRIHIWVAARH